MIPLPKHLSLELTRHCNYHCPFCYCVWHEFPELAKRNLSVAGWIKIIDEAIDSGTNDFLFTGGEVLLRKDINELIKYTRSHLPDGNLSLFTNGSLLTEERIRFLKRHKVHLATSLPRLTTYGVMTGTKRTCYPLLRKIARAKELHWPIQLSITVTKINAFEAKEIFCAAAIAGAKSIQMGAVMLEGRARNRTDLPLTNDEWKQIKDEIRSLPDCRVPYTFCDEMICICRDQPQEYLEKYSNPDAPPCPAGKDFGVIGPDGRYRKCLHTIIAFNF